MTLSETTIQVSNINNTASKDQENINNIKIMRLPHFIVQDEEGIDMLSFILKAEFPEWEENHTSLAKKTKAFFEQHPLDRKTSIFLDNIHALQDGGIDEEVLYNLALTYQHPERTDIVFEMIKKNKTYIQNPKELQFKIFESIDAMKQLISSTSFYTEFINEGYKDKNLRIGKLKEVEIRIQKLIDFFKPNEETTQIKKVILITSNPIHKNNSGSAYIFGEELLLKGNADNEGNLEHEFLHSIINPIVDKLKGKLTDIQKENIIKLASKQLKQDYGNNYYSLLCEELIRTYNDVFSKGGKPESFRMFKEENTDITDEIFQRALSQKEQLRENCKKMNIKTISDFREKATEYFIQFRENELRRIVFSWYEEYAHLEKKINFEKFILDKIIHTI